MSDRESNSRVSVWLNMEDINEESTIGWSYRLLGKVNDTEAIRWIETLYG